MCARRLRDDERTLWEGVARSISPLKKSRKAKASAASAPDTEPAVAAPAKTVSKAPPKAHSKLRPAGAPATAPKPAPKVAPPPLPLAAMGRKLKQRVARGRHEIDGRLDLHGMTQAEAHGALLHFLRGRQARGAKLVLVITGKGLRNADGFGERGVLKRMVPLWLGEPELRSVVLGFESAAIGHGGEGALYVSLRRARGE